MIGNDYLRKMLLDVSSKSIDYLRKNFCNNSELELIRGETIKADLISEKIIIDELKKYDISFKIVTEESNVVGSGDYTFVVDPLDGSVNYENCIPWCSVSIAVLPPRSKEIIAGVVSPVSSGMPFSFAKGYGCYEGNKRIEINKENKSNIIFTYVESEKEANIMASIVKEKRGLKLRSLGSSALELIYTSLNRSYAFVDLRSKLRNVDVAAALGFLSECGGIAFDEKGNSLTIDTDKVSVIGNVIASFNKSNVVNIIKILSNKNIV
ncbi:MAG: inositol monophosphatase family protein [Caldisphaera sp.]|jgi:myo-inositol-1(or 4)-monophosphatase|nr:inositol monophosphatase family protein [Caldisphaera sp.]PMP60205.1 MAG: inositol monophosphatase [Caldisphaera sp.]